MRVLFLVAAAAILMAPGARAESFYAGASIGESRLRPGDYAGEVQGAFGTLFAAYGAHAEMGRSSAGRVFGGAMLAPWLAIEIDYTRLGTIDTGYSDISIHGACCFGHDETSANAKLDALGLSAVVRTPVWHAVSAFARAGIARMRLQGSSESCHFPPDIPGIPQAVTCASTNRELSQTRPVAGLGIDYRLSDRWAARLAWDRWFGVGTSPANDGIYAGIEPSITGHGKFDVDFFSAGVFYRF
jgi:opacity protein-like surface antigen